MLSSLKVLIRIGPGLQVLISALLISLLVACVPQGQGPSVNQAESTNSTGPGTGTGATLYQEPTFPLSAIFIQEGSARTTTNFPLPVNFNDSFLIRGLVLSKYLRKLPNTTKFCLVGKYTHNPGQDNFFLMAAKPKSFTDLINKTTEFYLQVEPASDASNQNDCLTYNLSSTLISSGAAPTFSFGLTQLCASCTTSITSTPLKLFFNNGEEVPALSLGGLLLTVSGSSVASTNSCVESSLCKSRGFNCCLQGQCVKDGAIKPGVLTDPYFMVAQEDVRNNPSRFIVYPQFYFVCESRPETEAGAAAPSTNDPHYEAAIRLLEISHLYQCLNMVEGEFSYCTVKFAEASGMIPGNFSSDLVGLRDDMNFTTLNSNYNLNDFKNNIVKVLYGGKVLYEHKKTALTDASFVANTANDDLNNAQSINVTSALPSNAKDDNLYLTYKIDGTCERVGSALARCTKTYIQSHSDTESTTWHDSSKVYVLPHYADTSPTSNIIVRISGIIVPEDASTWVKATLPPRIIFNGAYNIFQNQKIEINYFVNGSVDELLKSKSSAQAKVNSMCTCAGNSKCNLRPILNDSQQVVNYECTYPTPTSSAPPINQTVYVSSKNVPHRYFDVNGVSYDTDYSTALDQEGIAFQYDSNNTLRPNNKTQYVGFNEIYGQFGKSGTLVARPAKYARVKQDQLYDIVVSSGVFASCQNCGSDYYGGLQKLFPQNFAGGAGGYTPDFYESRRDGNQSIYRSDDLLFGRACFLPASMIPWAHMNAADPTTQRRIRLAGQHFLFANGYTRDWYGFDYGSLIGSFDGVRWFSIGNQRRIKATSGKLFLAINAYFGDLGLDNSFTVTVSETSVFSSPIPGHDTESDGAECQRAHYCSNDKDCFANLGYDYVCQNVSGMITSWPQFDASGSEVVGSLSKTLASIVGGTSGTPKRCVYRGRGAPCHNDLSDVSSTFNNAISPGSLGCSANNVCAPTSNFAFNDRISRFGNSPVAQNIAEVTNPLTDTLGLAARIIGRPFNYDGTLRPPDTALTSLNSNNLHAICVPGKDLQTSNTVFHLNSRLPVSRVGTSDKILGIASTLSGNPRSEYFLSSCPATNDLGINVHLSGANHNLSNEQITKYTRSQNLSTSFLNAFTVEGMFNVTGNQIVSKIGYQPNACLRGAGASCFSNLDCGPSQFIATKVKNSTTSVNEAERKFWEEELVCGNRDYKLVNGGVKNVFFDSKKNVCCREFGNTFTVYTETESSEWHWCDDNGQVAKIAGINLDLNSTNRYSRVHTAYDKFTCNSNEVGPTKGFALSIKGLGVTVNEKAVNRMARISRQYLTLDAVNSRTCCTQNWVRNFAKTENGGGHKFDKTKHQTFNIEMFKHINWFEQYNLLPSVVDGPFYCADDGINHATLACEVRSFTDQDAQKYFDFVGALELIGIPQVAVKTNDEIYKNVNYNQESIAPNTPLDHTINPVAESGDFRDGTAGNRYYSAANYDAFEFSATGLKKIFSENEFNCCLPAGEEVPDYVTPAQCCTGFIITNSPPRRCCLDDFTDVTVYLNRYVSSEGRGLPDNSYDPKTGYIKDPGIVHQLAAQKNLCCSGTTMSGVALSYLHKPLADDKYIPGNSGTAMSRRFIYRTDAVDNNSESGWVGDFFNAGLKWNTHVYCVPTGLAQQAGGGQN